MATVDEIINYRLDNNLSQSEMAISLGISRELLNKIENKKLAISKGVSLAFKELSNSGIISQGNITNDTNQDYLTTRRKLKQGKNDNDGIVYVPISAQAGYSKRYKEPIYLNTLETAYLPGTRYRGEKYRIFEVDGDSMIPTLKDGQKVIAALVDADDWQSSTML